MANTWIFPQKTIDAAKVALNDAITQIKVPSFASINWETDEMCVKIEKAGKSEFRMKFKEEGNNVKLIESKRDIAFMHKPFLPRVEELVNSVMEKSGATRA